MLKQTEILFEVVSPQKNRRKQTRRIELALNPFFKTIIP